jgi:hypothetical protein
MRIPVVAGELCGNEPNRSAAMVNRAFAIRYFDGAAAIGRHLVRLEHPGILPAEIRGIVGDARETGLDREPPPIVYWCTGTMQPGTFFMVRTRGDLEARTTTIRRKVHELEPHRSVFGLTRLTDHISDAYAENRLRMLLFAFFAVAAITLASVGLCGTLSYFVNVRRREVALRM